MVRRRLRLGLHRHRTRYRASRSTATRTTSGSIGFGNAYLLTGDDRYLDAWRKQIDAVNAQKKVVDGKELYPHMYGDNGWYDYRPGKYRHGALELYYWSMQPDDRGRLPGGGWLGFLEGKDPGYPERALAADFGTIRTKVEGMRRDRTTPDTRLSDDPMPLNPATVTTLVELTLGGIYPGHRAGPLHCRVRHFDPDRGRAGLPEDVGALVEGLSATGTVLSLVNVNQSEARRLIVQAGGYSEHRFESVSNRRQRSSDQRAAPHGATRAGIGIATGAEDEAIRQSAHAGDALGPGMRSGEHGAAPKWPCLVQRRGTSSILDSSSTPADGLS